jgi:hypothetical protein
VLAALLQQSLRMTGPASEARAGRGETERWPRFMAFSQHETELSGTLARPSALARFGLNSTYANGRKSAYRNGSSKSGLTVTRFDVPSCNSAAMNRVSKSRQNGSHGFLTRIIQPVDPLVAQTCVLA